MITYDDIASAAEQIRGVAHRTPVATSRLLDAACGNRMFLKCENLQRVGAFKFRGAYNAVSRLSDEERAPGSSPTRRATMPRRWRWCARSWAYMPPS